MLEGLSPPRPTGREPKRSWITQPRIPGLDRLLSLKGYQHAISLVSEYLSDFIIHHPESTSHTDTHSNISILPRIIIVSKRNIESCACAATRQGTIINSCSQTLAAHAREEELKVTKLHPSCMWNSNAIRVGSCHRPGQQRQCDRLLPSTFLLHHQNKANERQHKQHHYSLIIIRRICTCGAFYFDGNHHCHCVCHARSVQSLL